MPSRISPQYPKWPQESIPSVCAKGCSWSTGKPVYWIDHNGVRFEVTERQYKGATSDMTIETSKGWDAEPKRALARCPANFSLYNIVQERTLFSLVNNLVTVVEDLRARLASAEKDIEYLTQCADPRNS